METKFTKGKWIADLRGGCCAVYPENRKEETNGCHISDSRNIFYSDKGAKYNGNNWDMDEETQANAKLIAAAPELLAACIQAAHHHQGAHSEIGFILNEAIKKATE